MATELDGNGGAHRRNGMRSRPVHFRKSGCLRFRLDLRAASNRTVSSLDGRGPDVHTSFGFDPLVVADVISPVSLQNVTAKITLVLVCVSVLGNDFGFRSSPVFPPRSGTSEEQPDEQTHHVSVADHELLRN